MTTEWAVLNNDVLEVYGSEESARHQLRDFYNSDARLVSRLVTEWTDVDGT